MDAVVWKRVSYLNGAAEAAKNRRRRGKLEATCRRTALDASIVLVYQNEDDDNGT